MKRFSAKAVASLKLAAVPIALPTITFRTCDGEDAAGYVKDRSPLPGLHHGGTHPQHSVPCLRLSSSLQRKAGRRLGMAPALHEGYPLRILLGYAGLFSLFAGLMEHGNHQPQGKQHDGHAGGEAHHRHHAVQQVRGALRVHIAGGPQAQARCVQHADGAGHAHGHS